jgi:glycosyltransferase involved in cell wall biosynthesis
MKLVSVIMPAFNSQRYIRAAIRSVLSQTYVNFELIIVDDFSQDNTKEIVRSFSDLRIKLIENTKNLGISKSLNKAIKLLKGDYIARMDADDICFPKRLEKQVSYLEKHKLDFVGSYITLIGEGIKSKIQKYPISSIFINYYLDYGNPFAHPSILCKSSILKKKQYIDLFSEDLYLWSNLKTLNLKWSNFPQPLLKYRIHNNNLSKNSATNKCARIIYYLNHKKLDTLFKILPNYKHNLDQFINEILPVHHNLDFWEKEYLLNQKPEASIIFKNWLKGKYSIYRTRILYDLALSNSKKYDLFNFFKTILISFFTDPLNFVFHVSLVKRNFILIYFFIRWRKAFQ